MQSAQKTETTIVVAERPNWLQLERQLFDIENSEGANLYSRYTGRDPGSLEFRKDLALDSQGTVLAGHFPTLQLMMLGWWLQGFAFANYRPLIELFRRCLEGPLEPMKALELVRERVVKKAEQYDTPFYSPIEDVCKRVLIDVETVSDALAAWGVTPHTINDLDRGRQFTAAEIRQLVHEDEDWAVCAVAKNEMNGNGEPSPFQPLVGYQVRPAHELNKVAPEKRSIETALKRNPESGEPYCHGNYVVARPGQLLEVQPAQGRVFYAAKDRNARQWAEDNEKAPFIWLLEPRVNRDTRNNLGLLSLLAAAIRNGISWEEAQAPGAKASDGKSLRPEWPSTKATAIAKVERVNAAIRKGQQQRERRDVAVSNVFTGGASGGDVHGGFKRNRSSGSGAKKRRKGEPLKGGVGNEADHYTPEDFKGLLK